MVSSSNAFQSGCEAVWAAAIDHTNTEAQRIIEKRRVRMVGARYHSGVSK
jgi:hypothetical protein